MRGILATLVLLSGGVMSGHAMELPRDASRFEIILIAADEVELSVGQIAVEPLAESSLTYEINWDDSKFSDQFLSMRPFKCLDGAKKQWCRVPYPYENKRTLKADDLTDLEYDLLFIWKKQGDYGIDMWNGVYYDMAVSGAGFTGTMNEMDMDILSAPPDDGNLRPVGEYDIEPADPDSHWLPVLELRRIE